MKKQDFINKWGHQKKDGCGETLFDYRESMKIDLEKLLSELLTVGQFEPLVSDDFGGQYSQGVCDDGAVILYDGKPMTPELIVAQLNELSEIKKRLYYKVIVSQNSR